MAKVPTKAELDAMTVDEIGHAYFMPMVQVYQAEMRKDGKNPREVRIKFYQSLSSGQQALFMFFSYYDHAVRSLDEFKSISEHYLTAKIFDAVKKGADYFNDGDMLRLLSETEEAMLNSDQAGIAELYRRLREISSRSIELIGMCIKQSPNEFGGSDF